LEVAALLGLDAGSDGTVTGFGRDEKRAAAAAGGDRERVSSPVLSSKTA
jgi:hypothetical protein